MSPNITDLADPTIVQLRADFFQSARRGRDRSAFAAAPSNFSSSGPTSAADAERAQRQFAVQAGIALVLPSKITRGIRTRPVRGTFTPRDALKF